MYYKDHLSMGTLYESQILNNPQTPVVIVQTQNTDNYEQQNLEMVVQNIKSVIHNSMLLLETIDNGASLEPWMTSKITLANDYISSVIQALPSQEDEEEECECHGGDLPFQADTTRGTGDGTMA